MNYKRLTNEELNKCKYPNLIAEIIESGYSTSTLADFMGMGSKKNGSYRKEGDPEIWNKINGKEELLVSHCAGLAKYYGVTYDYMFSRELHVMDGKPVAYWRWYEENRKSNEETECSKAIAEIYNELKSKPYLLDFMKACIAMTEQQRAQVLRFLKKKVEIK